MAGKDTFASDTFASDTYASGHWTGVGVDVDDVEPYGFDYVVDGNKPQYVVDK